MDRHLSPRVAYWCSSFDADIEAVASEVATLRRAFPGSMAWGVGARNWLRVSRHGIGVNARLHLLFRGLTQIAQRCFDVQHLFGGLGDWFHLRAVARRPVVLTMAVEAEASDAALLQKVDRFVAEWPLDDEELQRLGLSREIVRTIYPPVDLQRFQPSPPPGGPFTVVFASSPDRADWLRARGVELILDAAERCPDYRFLLIWRPWGNSLPAIRQLVDSRKLQNVEIEVGRVRDMAESYRRGHVTVAPFVDPRCSKPAPNSIVESLACGRPVVVTAAVKLARLIDEAGAGLVSPTAGLGLAECLRAIADSWRERSNAARMLAEAHFSESSFVANYRQLYGELI
jgi:glycosyltransferase involved in cell wall biosynthesis